MTYADKYDLRSLLKDLIYSTRTMRNSKTASEYIPEVVLKARELELILKGALAEVEEIEEEDIE